MLAHKILDPKTSLYLYNINPPNISLSKMKIDLACGYRISFGVNIDDHLIYQYIPQSNIIDFTEFSVNPTISGWNIPFIGIIPDTQENLPQTLSVQFN